MTRSLFFPVFLILLLSLIPIDPVEGVVNNNVHAVLAEDEDTIRFDPSSGTEFQVTFSSDTNEFDIHMNFSGIDSAAGNTDFDPTLWEISFDQTDFSVSYSEDVTVTVYIDTNLTTEEKGRSLELNVWGDIADDERDDVDTNSVTFTAAIAERDDVVLTVDENNDRKLVFPKQETQFNVFITNIGWSANSVTLRAKILDENADEWTVKVVYQAFDGMASEETRVGIINMTSPDIALPADYTLEVTAFIGQYGSHSIDLTARVEKPDLRVSEVETNYNPALDGITVQIRATIENNGGYVYNLNVRGEVKGHNDKWVRLSDVTVTEITNYNESIAVFTWEAEQTDDTSYTETWTIRVTVDDLNSVEESDEGNNQGEGMIEVRAIEKAKVSFNPGPALLILGIMLVFSAMVALDLSNRKQDEQP